MSKLFNQKDKYLVIPRKDLYNNEKIRELNLESEVIKLEDAVTALTPVIEQNLYFICKSDEPYADKVEKVIKEGIINEEIKKLVKQKRVIDAVKIAREYIKELYPTEQDLPIGSHNSYLIAARDYVRQFENGQ
jgi:5-formaminoimidazole-4-carboxamide-1-beta-D-ribofuranosyl 5'-monophosphate synthetase